MRSRWEDVLASLVRSLSTLKSEVEFRRLRAKEGAFERFEGPMSMVAYLTDREGDRDEKDSIYRALVVAVQERSDWQELATHLLWAGLWPALDAIYRRRLRDFPGDPPALVSEIGDLFTQAIGRAEMSRISRVAATLTWNTERLLKSRLRRERREQPRLVELLDDDQFETEGQAEEVVTRPPVSRLPASEITPTDEIKALRGWLLPFAGRDTDLLLAVVIEGENLKQAAARVGISHAAVRKRYRRALTKVKRHPFNVGVPHRPS